MVELLVESVHHLLLALLKGLLADLYHLLYRVGVLISLVEVL